MLSFFRKSRRNKKAASKKTISKKSVTQPSSDFDVATDQSGYDPYDTMPGVSREKFGMRRRDDGKWSF